MPTPRKEVLKKLKKGLDLNPDEVRYVREKIEPKYENNCSLCRLNTLINLGASLNEAFRITEC